MPGSVGSPRFALIERRRSVSLPFSPFTNGRRLGSSYRKLPSQISIKLSILKLDGSSFDVQIKRNATVGELKQAVEDVFTLSSMANQGLISWSHVWGHFCLLFEGQKLLNDKEYIESFLIRDGDQLHFIRHLSTNFNRVKRSKNLTASSKKHIKSSLSEPYVYEGEKEETGWVDFNSDIAEVNDNDYFAEDNERSNLIKHPEFKLSHFFKDWLFNSRSCFVGKSRCHTGVQYPRFSKKFLRMGSKFTQTRA